MTTLPPPEPGFTWVDLDVLARAVQELSGDQVRALLYFIAAKGGARTPAAMANHTGVPAGETDTLVTLGYLVAEPDGTYAPTA